MKVYGQLPGRVLSIIDRHKIKTGDGRTVFFAYLIDHIVIEELSELGVLELACRIHQIETRKLEQPQRAVFEF